MNITVIGAGNSGLAMAAHLSYFGNKVSLWNRSESTIAKLLETKVINVDGVITGPVKIHNVTSNIDIALQDVELILVTTPASAHSDLATLLASRMAKDIPIILNPGRTFGVLNFHSTFMKYNSNFEPRVAETQTIIYTCRKVCPDEVVIYSLKKAIKIASLKRGDAQNYISKMPECIRPYFIPADSFLETSLGNVGLVLHCAPFMLNTGWTECKTVDYKYYYDGITQTIGRFIQHIDDERVVVGKALGVELETTMDWMKREYGTKGTTLFECIQNNIVYKDIDAPKSVYHRYIFEDVPFGLVPFERIAKDLGISTPYITLTIDLANALLEEDFRLSMLDINLETVKMFFNYY